MTVSEVSVASVLSFGYELGYECWTCGAVCKCMRTAKPGNFFSWAATHAD